MKPEDRTFIVSGGCSGLGLAVVYDLLEAGAHVLLLDLNDKLGESLVKELGTRTKYCRTDVSETASVEAGINTCVEWIKETGKPLAGVIAAAGVGAPAKIYDSRAKAPVAMSNIDFIMNVNVRGTIDLVRQAIPHLIKNTPFTEDGERGVLILVASSAAFDGQPGQVAYAASKGAIASLTLPLARDVARYGIRAVTIAPSLFQSPMTEQLTDKAKKSLERAMEFPVRPGNAKEFSSLTMHAIHNSMLNGTVIRIDGAMRMPSKM